ncbi:protein Jade-1 isoform X2 [Rhinatrema bivittatum]|uniref:protein Jade-1 isoform X2 n=1 Tax=Rhinatrema bivittatum TaxID=194408 RepID=UPI001129BA44|nr:protein Jade-1 isoform X2 [Rhinatrema bivittatum]
MEQNDCCSRIVLQAACCYPEIMKRGRLPSSSEESEDNDSLSPSWFQHSRSHDRSSCSRHEDKKPSEVFRTDLITAMKLHDSHQLNPDDYYVLADPWRQEWEKGVQVPVSQESFLEPVARVVAEKDQVVTFIRPRKYIQSSGSEPPEPGYVDIRTLAESMCRYDLNCMDVTWLELINEEFKEIGITELDEYTMERVMEEFEQRCYDNMNHAIETEEGLGIEYDEDVVCDVCQSPDGEDGNEMVFCDKCNICVHQACYGILKVPEGSWLCRTCALGVQPKCLLCPKKGGAMKPTRSGTKWVHVSCALWIPEVSIGSPEKMEPITKVSHIPSSRWALVCSLCSEKIGACIQCSVKNCRTAFHVTCAFDRGLEMKTILTESDEVKFKSYCPKHSSCNKPEEDLLSECASESGSPESVLHARKDSFADIDQNQQEAQRVSLRKQKLQQLEDEFYSFVDVSEVSQALCLSEEMVEFLFQYWKLKRKANFNKPLITPKKDEEDNLAKREQDVLIRRLQLFTHLRQDLERVRNLTYMVTRREKIKRSVCKVQEQIFNLYTKLMEQEKISGVPSSHSLETILLFNTQPVSPDAPQIEDLKWHSAFFRKQLGSSLVCSAKTSLERERTRKRLENINRASLRQPSLTLRKEDTDSPDSLLSLKKTFSEGRVTSVEQKNRILMPDHRKRRDSRPPCEVVKAELKEKPARHNHKPLRPAELTQRQLENKRAFNHSSSKSAATSGQRRPSGEMVPKCNGPLIKVHNQTPVKVPTAPTSPVKNWGGFRIPKKGERQQQGEAKEGPCRQNSNYQFLGKVSSKERTKSRLKTDSENDGYIPDAEMSDSETETAEKCRQQRLTPNSSINRRYDTDIIRRSILAS